MTIPRVLVLMATYQGMPWILDQMASVLAQEDVHVCVAVGDDGSKDGTAEAIGTHFDGDVRVGTTIWPTGSGSAGENFRRLIHANDAVGFDYIAFADQDDLWRPRKLTVAINRLLESECAGYSSAVDAFWEDGRTRELTQSGRQRGADFLFEGAGQGCTFVMTYAFFARLRRLVMEYPVEASRMHYHDWMTYVAARAMKAGWFFDPVPNMAYRQHRANELGARSGLSSVIRRLDKIRDGWFKGQVEAALAFSKVAGSSNEQVDVFSRIFTARPSALRRLKLATFVLRQGRRKLSDRCILVIASLAGWL